jgi:hypothetical protein
MAKEEDRQPKTFIIQHKKIKRQRVEFDRLSVPLRHLPENLSSFTRTCPSCGKIFSPDWFKKHEISMEPVKPRFETKGVEYQGPARWRLQQVSQECPNCKSQVMIPLPVNKMMKRGSLWGDDAERRYQDKTVHIYSLVGADQNVLPEFDVRVKGLKQRLLASVPADRWRIHMKVMWSGSRRRKHPVFQTLSPEAVIDFTRQLLALIKSSNLFIYNIALTTDRGQSTDTAVRSRLRTEAYIMLVLNAIDEWTTKGAQPNIYFDSEKDSKANEIIHSWARDAFGGSQHSLLYGFLAKGIEIPAPKFVSPGSFPGLEVADFVSFTIARYYYRRWEGKEIEIDPKQMGLATYLGYDFNGDLLWKRQEGYPWDQFCH